jgi:hypothetical protein
VDFGGEVPFARWDLLRRVVTVNVPLADVKHADTVTRIHGLPASTWSVVPVSGISPPDLDCDPAPVVIVIDRYRLSVRPRGAAATVAM